MKSLKDLVLVAEEDDIEEATTTGDIAGYNTPMAFNDGSDESEKKKRRNATNSTGYKIVENVMKKTYTLKEVQKWLRGLEENKWRKRYKVDAKRITHFLNNGTNSTLPQSLSRKNENATYNRERSLAKQYVKHMKEQEKVKKQNLKTENKFRELIRNIIIKELKNG